MSGINKAIIVGNLGQDPEVKFMPNGDAVCNLSIATSEKWKDKSSGENKEVTEWHRIVLFRKLAEIAGEYLVKGSKVYIEGKIKTRKWQDQSGADRYTTEINANQMQMLSVNEKPPERQATTNGPTHVSEAAKSVEEDFSDEIPF